MACSECQHHRDKVHNNLDPGRHYHSFYQQLCCKFSHESNIVCCFNQAKYFKFKFPQFSLFDNRASYLQLWSIWHLYKNIDTWVILATIQQHQNRKCVQSLLETRAGPSFTFVCSKKATLCLLSFNASVGLTQKMRLTPFFEPISLSPGWLLCMPSALSCWLPVKI